MNAALLTEARIADWDPNVVRDGVFFDDLFVRLRPECEALIAMYEDSRSALIPMAHVFQEHEGFTSPNALAAIAYLLKLPLAVVESTISFYTLFYRRPVGKYMLQVCRNLSCIINGAEEIMAYCREQLASAIWKQQRTDCSHTKKSNVWPPAIARRACRSTCDSGTISRRR